MKLGILADIHEDVEALEKALDLLRQEGADRLVVLGDVFHLGQRVTETADWLEWRDWGVPFLAEPFEIRGSAIHIPDRPGAGIAWDEAAVKKFAI